MTTEADRKDISTLEERDRAENLARANRFLKRVVLMMAVGLVATIAWAMSDGARDSDIEATKAIVLGLNAAVEAADAGSVGDFFAEDAYFEDPAARTAVTGRSAVKSMYMGFLSASAPITNTAVFVGPDFAVTEFVWTQPCTFAACSEPMFNQPIDVRGIVLHIIEDGEVVRETDYVSYPRNVVLP